MAIDKSVPVLIVDDYRTMVRIIRNLLTQLGFSTTSTRRRTAAPRSLS